MLRWRMTVLALAVVGGVAFGQGTKADYERAKRLAESTRNKVFKSSIRPVWSEDGKSFWYRNDLGGGKFENIRIDAETGERTILSEKDAKSAKPLISQTVRASTRTGSESEIAFVNKRDQAVRLYWSDTNGRRVSYGTIAPGQAHKQHTYGGHVWFVADAEGRTLLVVEAADSPTEVEIPASARPVQRGAAGRRPRPGSFGRAESPDGKRRAFIKDHNVWIRESEGSVEYPLSASGAAGDEFVANFNWSPDGRKLVARKIKRGKPRTIHFVESSPRDQLQPVLHSMRYDKPGDELDRSFPHLFDVEKRSEIPISRDLFPEPWSIDEIRWRPDSKRFTFLYNQRGHQTLRILGVDAETGACAAIIDETSKTFIDYAGKRFSQYLDDTGEIIWMSERSGWNHLYLVDAATGKVKNAITAGEWVVRGVDRVDVEKREVWFRASGIDPDQDPYHVHYCRVGFDGSTLVRLTAGDGTHRVEFSPDGRFLIDVYSRVDQPPITELRRTSDGSLVCELERADWSTLLATGWKPPERFSAKGRDRKTDIYGVIWRPTNFDASKKYPVIEQIYAGPQGSFVPKEFASYYRAQSIAELGFIVVQIDGMGTSNRSKAFHDVCWKNLADAGFPDRIAWLRACAERNPWMDLSRVGIYGGSAGGQNALGGLLFHPDFYKVGVADCGCHDNRMDKVWWNELWMGWPIGPHYAEQSNVANAHKLRGKLLLTVGEMDNNVDPASTMQVVNALIRADKDFDLLVVPGGRHGVGETPYAARRRMDFFVRHLHGVEPRRDG